ncbi:MAG: hypothetical protein OXC25_13730 [Thiotrichales bacterium]|nr:hypothetical protein [Thiotrichales bacterium]MCY4286142.1 hypothetical protein [Thiotrichales bacterium]MCY4350899.1 hypothetical protein [Thiotrichales bacterium]
MTSALTTLTGPLTPEQAETARIALDALAPNTRRAYRIARHDTDSGGAHHLFLSPR